MLDRREQLALLPLADAEADRLLAVAFFSEISLTRPLGRLLHVLRLSPVLDTLDRFVSNYRTRLGRFVPEGPAPRRYP
jgi:hypothetical protein